MKNVVKCSAEKATHAKKGRMGSKSATYTPAFSNTFNLNPRQSTQAKRGWNPLVSDSNNYCIRTIHFYTHQRENDLILRTSFVPNDILPLVCMHVQEDHAEVSVSIAHPTYIKSPIQKFYVIAHTTTLRYTKGGITSSVSGRHFSPLVTKCTDVTNTFTRTPGKT